MLGPESRVTLPDTDLFSPWFKKGMHRPGLSSFSIESLMAPQPRFTPLLYNGYMFLPPQQHGMLTNPALSELHTLGLPPLLAQAQLASGAHGLSTNTVSSASLQSGLGVPGFGHCAPHLPVPAHAHHHASSHHPSLGAGLLVRGSPGRPHPGAHLHSHSPTSHFHSPHTGKDRDSLVRPSSTDDSHGGRSPLEGATIPGGFSQQRGHRSSSQLSPAKSGKYSD